MCLAASYSDELVITRQQLERSIALVTELEQQMPMVYSRIGMTAGANASQKILAFLDRYDGEAPFTLLYRYMHKDFPDVKDFETIITGMIDAGYISITKNKGSVTKL
jgi:hypothetical protein